MVAMNGPCPRNVHTIPAAAFTVIFYAGVKSLRYAKNFTIRGLSPTWVMQAAYAAINLG